MRKLSVLDLAFFAAESDNSPKHVAGLWLCRKPAKAPANFALNLVEKLKQQDNIGEPFNLVISFLGWKGPHWVESTDFSLADHVFYHRPGKAISWKQAKNLVCELHEPMLDRAKPLWEFHLIDGIRGRKFAVYMKLHHAYADGMTMASWMSSCLSENPDSHAARAVWNPPPARRETGPDNAFQLGKTMRGLTRQSWAQVLATGGIAKITAQQLLERAGITHSAVSVPFTSKRDTRLTGNASPGRSLATASVSMERVKRICRATRSTLNHVALTCIDGALHSYLEDCGTVLDHPITIQMPVNLRKEGDDKSGNKVGIVLVELAQPTDDPFVRLREIGFTLRNVRNQIDGVPGSAIEQYSILAGTFGELIEKLRLSDRLPTNGYTLVSNVPGPKKRLYLNGAEVEELYPISALSPGLLMNITLISYAGDLEFGLVATHDLEQLDSLAQYIEDEFEELENAVFNPV